MNFEEFCLAGLPGLLRFAVMLTGERELAQDIVQEVLCRAHGRWRRIVATDRPELYVKRMITNEFLSWRRRRRVVTVPLDADVPLPDPAGDESDDLWQRLAGAAPAAAPSWCCGTTRGSATWKSPTPSGAQQERSGATPRVR